MSDVKYCHDGRHIGSRIVSQDKFSSTETKTCKRCFSRREKERAPKRQHRAKRKVAVIAKPLAETHVERFTELNELSQVEKNRLNVQRHKEMAEEHSVATYEDRSRLRRLDEARIAKELLAAQYQTPEMDDSFPKQVPLPKRRWSAW